MLRARRNRRVGVECRGDHSCGSAGGAYLSKHKKYPRSPSRPFATALPFAFSLKYHIRCSTGTCACHRTASRKSWRWSGCKNTPNWHQKSRRRRRLLHPTATIARTPWWLPAAAAVLTVAVADGSGPRRLAIGPRTAKWSSRSAGCATARACRWC